MARASSFFIYAQSEMRSRELHALCYLVIISLSRDTDASPLTKCYLVNLLTHCKPINHGYTWQNVRQHNLTLGAACRLDFMLCQ